MTRTDKNKSSSPENREAGPSLAGLLPFVLLAGLLVAISIYMFMGYRSEDRQKSDELHKQVEEKQDLRAMHDAMVAEEAELREQVREENIEKGLDPEYPSFKFPLYEGMEVLESTREEATSTLGEAMDKWYIKGQVDAKLDDIQQFYRDLLQEQGFRQMQYISIPGGYDFKYANEWYDTQFTIEQTSNDPLPRVEITIYRVRDDSVQIGD